MVRLWCIGLVAFIATANAQQYFGPRGHQAGIPISSSGLSEMLRAGAYDAIKSPAPVRSSGPPRPSFGSPPPQNYVRSGPPPRPLDTFGPPPPSRPVGNFGPRYKIIPASDFKIPQQHSNLIRYIVLKEFQLAPNGSVTPLKMGLGRTSGVGSPELEIMKVQLPNSGESGGASDINEVRVKNQSDNSIENAPGNNDEDDGDYDDDRDDNDSSVQPQNTVSQVVPAKGGQITGQKSANPQSSETEAFMFSDPASGERRQSTVGGGGVFNGVRNTLRNSQDRVRGRNQARRNRNRNRVNRVRTNVANAIAPRPTTFATPVQMDELQNALQVLSRYFNSQAAVMRQPSATSPVANAIAAAPKPQAQAQTEPQQNKPTQQIQTQRPQAQALIATPAAPSAPAAPAAIAKEPVASTASASNSINSVLQTSASSNSISGGFFNNPSRPADSVILSAGDGSSSNTQLTFPAATYGPPPGQAGFQGNNAAASPFPNLLESISKPVNQAIGLKSEIVSSVINGATAAVRGLTAAVSAVGNSVGNAAASAGSASPSSGYGPPAPSSSGTPSSGYGAPAAGASPLSGGGFNPLQSVLALKGSAFRTVANTGKAVVGIAGTKGQAVVNQVGIVANTVSKGFADSGSNKHDAFQKVIQHIQNIFAANQNLRQSGGTAATGGYQ